MQRRRRASARVATQKAKLTPESGNGPKHDRPAAVALRLAPPPLDVKA